MTGQRLTGFSPLLLPPLTRRRGHTTNRVRLHSSLSDSARGAHREFCRVKSYTAPKESRILAVFRPRFRWGLLLRRSAGSV